MATRSTAAAAAAAEPCSSIGCPLKGQTALVTGASNGLGYAIALSLGQSGARVLVNGSNAERVASAVGRLRAEAPAGQFEGAQADLSTAAGCAALAAAHPSVDILVNNLGVYETKGFFELTDGDWERVLNVNVMSGVRLCRLYLKGMLERNRGRVVFVGSEASLEVPVDMIHYGASKAAQVAAARGIAELTAGTRVTVNSVLPGTSRSPGIVQFFDKIAKERGIPPERMEEEFYKTDRPSSLIRRLIEPHEISSVVTYICTQGAAAINGTAIRVDGGIVKFAFC
eukprot:m51a1_g11164 putative 3-oxoacyl-[acyl-carrier protein] reductase (284) ;mRNA; f:289738-290780